ncbi:MAG: hypothetical protein ACM3X9_03390 [Bacillota bacterium]
MAGTSKAKTKFDADRYWSGVFTGVFLGCFFICVLAFIFIRYQGLKIAINPEQVARLVQAKMQTEVKRDIPQILEEIKKKLPQEIAGNFGELESLTIGFGNSQVKLPAELITGIKGEFNRIIEGAIINTINNYDTLGYEEKIGQNVHEMIKSFFEQEIVGKTYLLKTSRWFSVPVKIVGGTGNQLQVGI